MFWDALTTGRHECYLRPDTRLPMMYIDDCLRSVVEFMEVPDEQLKLRTYNIHAMSFTPEEIVEEVRKYVPHLEVKYKPDSRQEIGKLVCETGIKFVHVCFIFIIILQIKLFWYVGIYYYYISSLCPEFICHHF